MRILFNSFMAMTILFSSLAMARDCTLHVSFEGLDVHGNFPGGRGLFFNLEDTLPHSYRFESLSGEMKINKKMAYTLFITETKKSLKDMRITLYDKKGQNLYSQKYSQGVWGSIFGDEPEMKEIFSEIFKDMPTCR